MALRQMEALGVTSRRRELHRIYRGVYAIVPPSLLPLKGRYLAAVLACGEEAALSHRSAAHLHELRPTSRGRIDVVVPGRTARRHDGIDLHRALHLEPRDITTVDAIPVTTVARTALDLAQVLRRRQVERALDQAEILETFDLRALNDQIHRNPHHPGTPTLTAILNTHYAGTTATWSELEEMCLAASRRAGVPPPTVGPFLDPGDGEPPIRVDFAWYAQKVVVETDGRKTHLTTWAFENDRRRDQRLAVAGWRTVRITYRQLAAERARIERLLVSLLTQA